MTILYNLSANGFSNQVKERKKQNRILQNDMEKKKKSIYFRSMKAFYSGKLKILSHRQTFNMSF